MSSVPIDKLQAAIDKALSDYAQDVNADIKVLSREFAKKGAQAVKRAAQDTFGSGRYSRGWTSTVEETRLGSTGIIYNKTPGLPHLLENGHAKRGGDRVPGSTHIAPVEEKLVTEFQKAVEEKL